MYQKKFVAALMVLAMLCAGLSGCFRPNASDPTESTTGRNPVQTAPTTETDNTDPSENTTQPTEAEPVVCVDIETVGGAVIVGVIGYDEQGWYLQPEQPLNVSYEYFLDKPSVFPEQTRISMFDPSVDGVEKTRYLDQTVTAEGTFRFHRDDFETLYFAP